MPTSLDKRDKKLPVPVIALVSGTPNIAALTIDDGPNFETTPLLLEILSRHKCKANFFVLGQNVEQFPELAKAIVANGHELFNHGFNHAAFENLTIEQIIEQLKKTEALLTAFRPTPSPYPIRLPYGMSYGSEKVHEAITAWRSDVVIVQWSLTAEEWLLLPTCRSHSEVRDQCAAKLKTLAEQNWDGRIVLTHDWQPLVHGVEGSNALAPTICVEILDQFLAKLEEKKLRTVALRFSKR